MHPTPLLRDLPRCLYPLTAPAPPATPPLDADARAAVAIVGGGFTGLSTALHLAERGVDVALVEAHEPGWGASGRNGGQVNAGLKYEPEAAGRALGTTLGERLATLGSTAPGYLFDLVARLRIDCEAERGGTLRAAYHPAQVAALEDSRRQWRARGVELALLDAPAVHALTGTPRYVAAIHDPRGGSVNPLALARGLAARAVDAGARVHGQTRALKVARTNGRWQVTTPGGTLSAERLVLATDGYADDLWPGLRTSVVPIYSTIIATRPLPPELAAAVMPTRAVLYEVGTVTTYYRRDAAGRLLMGGRGVQREAREQRDYKQLMAYAERLWPALRGIEWTHWWNGQFALTPDFYPRLHEPAPGVLIAHGYSGRGVALAVSVGRELAAALTGTPLEELSLPRTPIPRIPFHRFWRVGVEAGILLGRVRDRLGL
jgi:glycine/D-amino acid oxidase-like deaminating enzyme